MPKRKSHSISANQSNNSNNNSNYIEISDSESDIELSYQAPHMLSSFKRITKRIEESEKELTLSQELEQDFEMEMLSQRDFKRLHKEYDVDVNDNNASPPISSDEEGSETDYSSDEEQEDDGYEVIDLTNEDNYTDDEKQFVAKEDKRLRDNGWLQRVTTHLLPKSRYKPLPQDQMNYGKIFLELKKEWGYKLGNFRTLDQGECAMCGHIPVSSLFKIRNIYTQQKTETGSTCITQFRVLDKKNHFYSKGQSFHMIKNDIRYATSERNAETNYARRFIM